MSMESFLMSLTVFSIGIGIGMGNTKDWTAAMTIPKNVHSVSVELKDFSIAVDKASLSGGGKVTFQVKNVSGMTHEMVVLKTDLPADALTVVNKKVNEKVAGKVIGEIEALSSGLEKEMTLDLPVGSYVLFCNIEGHYEKGMRISFTVSDP